ncbi:MAG TPA: ferredoxin [Nonomuraea sp.]|nr:ferredoxin [Nonomuraea sp.]
MRVVADRERCIGAGQCVLTLPEFFDQSDEDGRVLLLKEEPAKEEIVGVRQAVRLCPMHAISLQEVKEHV